jgi:hypothetical protein
MEGYERESWNNRKIQNPSERDHLQRSRREQVMNLQASTFHPREDLYRWKFPGLLRSALWSSVMMKMMFEVMRKKDEWMTVGLQPLNFPLLRSSQTCL